MSRNQEIAQRLLQEGRVPRDVLERALKACQSHPETDLLTLLQQWGQLDSRDSRLTLSSQFDSAPALSQSTRSSQTIIGAYSILEELGRGAMGVVYRAQSPDARQFALKWLNKPSERFAVEAEAMARLDHPQIVKVLDSGQHLGRPFLVMPLVTGRGLDEALKATGALPWEQAAEHIANLAEALQHAHDQDVFHRDLKPSNILLTDDHEVVLTDFGLAKLADSQEYNLTQSNVMIGTPQYSSPEQLQGHARHANAQSDIYSLGVCLFELLTGRLPFVSDAMVDLVVAVTMRPAPAPSKYQPELPKELDSICLRCLEKQPEDRYPAMADLAQDLRQVLNDSEDGLLSADSELGAGARSWGALLLILTGLMVAATGALLWTFRKPPTVTVTVETEPPGLTLMLKPLAGKQQPALSTEQLTLTHSRPWIGPPGRYSWTLKDEGYKASTQSSVFDWRAGERVRERLVFSRELGRVTLISDPQARETVSFEADFQGLTASSRAKLPLTKAGKLPLDESWPTGFWRARLKAPGHFPKELEFQVQSDRQAVFNETLVSRRVWSFPLPKTSTHKYFVADINSDGVSELVIYGHDGQVYVLRAGGVLWTGFDVQQKGLVGGARLDKDGDGLDELYFLTNPGLAIQVNLKTKKLNLLTGLKGAKRLVNVDLDGDGQTELLAWHEKACYGFHDGARNKGWSFEANGSNRYVQVQPLDSLGGQPGLVGVVSKAGDLFVLRERGKGSVEQRFMVNFSPETYVDLRWGPPGAGGARSIWLLTRLGGRMQLRSYQSSGELEFKKAIETEGPSRLVFITGREDRYALVGRSQVRVFDGQWRQVWSQAWPGSFDIHWVQSWDVDGDGQEDLCLSDSQTLVIFGHDDGRLKFRERFPHRFMQPKFCDLDKDSQLELMTLDGEQRLRAWSCLRSLRSFQARHIRGWLTTPRATKDWVFGPGPQAFHKSTGRAFEYPQDMQREMRGRPVWDGFAGQLLTVSDKAVRAWVPGQSSSQETVKGEEPGAVCVLADEWVLGDARGKLRSYKRGAWAQPLWECSLTGRVSRAPWPLDLDKDGEVDHFFCVTMRGQLALVSHDGALLSTLTVPGYFDADPVIWPSAGGMRIILASQEGRLILLELQGQSLKYLRSLRLSGSLTAPPTIFQRREPVLAVGSVQGVTFVSLDLKKVFDLDSGSARPVGCFRNFRWSSGEAGLAVCWYYVSDQKTVNRSRVILYRESLKRVMSSALGSSMAELVAGGDDIVAASESGLEGLVFERCDPSSLKGYFRHPKLLKAGRLITSRAYEMALEELSKVEEESYDRTLLQALARLGLGQRKDFQILLLDQPEKLKAKLRDWAKRSYDNGRQWFLAVIGERPKEAGAELGIVPIKLQRAALSPTLDFMTDPVTARTDLAVRMRIRKRVTGFREGRKYGLIMNRGGFLDFDFKLKSGAEMDLVLTHMALTANHLGSAAIQITCDDRVVVPYLAVAGERGIYRKDVVKLGVLKPGRHGLTIRNLSGHPTIYSIKQLDIVEGR